MSDRELSQQKVAKNQSGEPSKLGKLNFPDRSGSHPSTSKKFSDLHHRQVSDGTVNGASFQTGLNIPNQTSAARGAVLTNGLELFAAQQELTVQKRIKKKVASFRDAEELAQHMAQLDPETQCEVVRAITKELGRDLMSKSQSGAQISKEELSAFAENLVGKLGGHDGTLELIIRNETRQTLQESISELFDSETQAKFYAQFAHVVGSPYAPSAAIYALMTGAASSAGVLGTYSPVIPYYTATTSSSSGDKDPLRFYKASQGSSKSTERKLVDGVLGENDQQKYLDELAEAKRREKEKAALQDAAWREEKSDEFHKKLDPLAREFKVTSETADPHYREVPTDEQVILLRRKLEAEKADELAKCAVTAETAKRASTLVKEVVEGRWKLKFAALDLSEEGKKKFDQISKDRAACYREIEKLNKEHPGLVDMAKLKELNAKVTDEANNAIDAGRKEAADKVAAEPWYVRAGKSIPRALEASVDLVVGNAAYYGGGALGFVLGQGWEWSEAGAAVVNANRSVMNKIGVGSVLGSDEQFASSTLVDNYFAVNPLVQAGEGVGALLQGVDQSYDEYQRWVMNVGEDQKMDRQQFKEYQKHDTLLKVGKGAIKTAEAAGGLALTLSTGNTSALKAVASAGGLSAAAATADELYVSQTAGESFKIGRIVNNTISGTADSLLFMGALSRASRAAATARFGAALPKTAEELAQLSPKRLDELNKALKMGTNLGRTVDVAEGVSDAPEMSARVVNAAASGNVIQMVGAVAGVGVTVADTFDVSLSGALNHKKGAHAEAHLDNGKIDSAPVADTEIQGAVPVQTTEIQSVAETKVVQAKVSEVKVAETSSPKVESSEATLKAEVAPASAASNNETVAEEFDDIDRMLQRALGDPDALLADTGYKESRAEDSAAAEQEEESDLENERLFEQATRIMNNADAQLGIDSVPSVDGASDVEKQDRDVDGPGFSYDPTGWGNVSFDPGSGGGTDFGPSLGGGSSRRGGGGGPAVLSAPEVRPVTQVASAPARSVQTQVAPNSSTMQLSEGSPTASLGGSAQTTVINVEGSASVAPNTVYVAQQVSSPEARVEQKSSPKPLTAPQVIPAEIVIPTAPEVQREVAPQIVTSAPTIETPILKPTPVAEQALPEPQLASELQATPVVDVEYRTSTPLQPVPQPHNSAQPRRTEQKKVESKKESSRPAHGFGQDREHEYIGELGDQKKNKDFDRTDTNASGLWNRKKPIYIPKYDANGMFTGEYDIVYLKFDDKVNFGF